MCLLDITVRPFKTLLEKRPVPQTEQQTTEYHCERTKTKKKIKNKIKSFVDVIRITFWL